MAIDWAHGHRIDEVYGMLVDPFDLDREYGRVSIGYGELDANYYTDEKISGSITVSDADAFPYLNNRLLRIYARAVAADGSSHTRTLGTFFMRKAGAELSQGGKTKDIELHSMIYRHMKDTEGAMWTWIVEGTAAWARLVVMATSYVHSTIVKDADVQERTFTKTVPMVRRPMIEPMNYACDFLGCGSLDVKPDGTLWVHRYIEPSKRPVVWVFEDGFNCMYGSDIAIDTNEDDMPNAVRVSCEKNGIVYHAERVLPPSSPYSLEQRGLHVVVDHAHNELGEAAEKGIQAAVDRKCDEYFSRLLSLAVSIQIEHPYAPIRPGDAVRFICGTTDVTGIVHAMQTELAPGLPTTTTIDVIGGALGNVYP